MHPEEMTACLQSRYSRHKVLVTGGLGFIGSNLCLTLLDLGAYVTLLAPHPEDDGRPGIDTLLRRTRIVEGDIRNSELMDEIVQGQEFIFHLAGKSGAVASLEDRLEDLEVNFEGSVSLLEACRKRNPSARVLYPGTQLQYGRGAGATFTEDSPLKPTSPHGSHRALAEKYHLLYHERYGLHTICLRIANPFGPRQKALGGQYGIINWFLHLARKGQQIPIYGDGSQRRCYFHVDDLVEAMLLAAADDDSAGEVYNVAGAHPIPLVEMAQAVIKAVGGGEIFHLPWPEDARQVEPGDILLSIDKISNRLGWRPRLTVEEGLKNTLEVESPAIVAVA